MAFYIDWTEKLQSTRLWLEDVNAQINDPGNYQKLIGFLNFISSDINPKVIQQEMLDNAGMSEYVIFYRLCNLRCTLKISSRLKRTM
jgi:hypothetical protein